MAWLSVTTAMSKYTTIMRCFDIGKLVSKNYTEKIIIGMNGMNSKGSEKRLNEIFKEIKSLNPEILAELNKIIRLYSQAQMIIGFLDADSLYRYGKAYADRKKAQGEIKKNFEGTSVEKEGQAEIEIYELRLKEAEAKAESRKWQNLFKSIDNLIIALRRDERIAAEEYKKANDLYEG